MECASVLFVMPEGMQQEFGRLASDRQLEWAAVVSCDDARAELAKNPGIGVVVSNDSLSDGSWYCLLQELVKRDLPADLLVVVPAGCDARTIMSSGISGILKYPLEASAGTLIGDAAQRAAETIGATSR